MREEITLKNSKAVILRLWSTVPESKDFGAVEYVRQCSQQPDLFMLHRKKKSICFSTRSFLVVPGAPSKVLGQQPYLYMPEASPSYR